MDLRIYTKSGNDYYIDISNYDYEEMLRIVSDAMDRGDLLTLESGNQVSVIKFKEVEYFEIIRDNEVEKEETSNAIGFNK